MKYFNTDEFEKLGIAKDTLLTFAVNNLHRIIPQVEKVGKNGTYGLLAGGIHEANLILFHTLWTKENFDVDGNIVVSIPNRDLIFITGSNDTSSIQKIKKNSEIYYQTEAYPISTSFYQWNGEKFEKIAL